MAHSWNPLLGHQLAVGCGENAEGEELELKELKDGGWVERRRGGKRVEIAM
jgi:hypothetical protein